MRYLLLAFSFFLVTSVLCQSCKEEVTSARSMLVAADSMMWSNPDSALLVLEQIPDSRELRGEERSLYALLLTQARYKSCVLLENDSLIQIAVDYYEGGGKQERLAQAYFYWGCVYMENKEFPKAISLYLKSLELMPKKDSIFVAMLYSHLGNCYNEQDLHSTAREMYRKGYNLCAVKDSARSFYALRDIGNTFLLEYQLDSALCYYQQALKIASSLQDNECLSLIYKNIAGLYNELGRYMEAESALSKALPYLTVEEDYTSACSIKGDILNSLNRNDSAVYYWKIGARSSNIYVKTSSYNHLFEGYKKMKDWENATVYVDSFILFYDSIQMMNYRAELDELMDNHLIELHKRELSVRNQRIVAGLAVLFLLFMFVLVIVYLWRDARRKKEYMALQQRLMENRAEVMLLNEIPESASNTKVAELHKLEEERFSICVSIFRTTEGSRKLDELKKATAKMQVSIADTYRQVMVSDIRKTFADVMKDLKEHYPGLTNDDLLYCILSLLRCSKFIVLCILDVSSDAIKTRKSRIKNKIDEELFNRMFDY